MTIGLIWVDPGMETSEQAGRFVDLVRMIQPQCLINGRVGSYRQELLGDYQNMGDNGMPPGGLDEPWETPQTLNGTWGYSQHDFKWKTAETLIHNTIDIASKGRNYLINAGPMADGKIPEAIQVRFRELGAWMHTYGDSIYAGYRGSISSVAKRSAPRVDGEYESQLWNSDIEVIRRAKSGAVASDIYNNKIVAERSYMQTTNTRVVTFEMCGDDGLQARSSFAGQTGTCNYGVLNTALNNCTTYQQSAMQYINANAYSGVKLKVITNLYYPGYNADNALSSCNDPTTGQKVNKQNIFLPYIAMMNWRACNFAAQYGFACADSFAQYMAPDYDSNGDGLVDADAIKFVAGESESAYVNKIVSTYRSTIRDANTHFVNASTSYDYILSDNTHPTYTGATVSVGLFGGTGSGSGAPDYTDAQIVGGKNRLVNSLKEDRVRILVVSIAILLSKTTRRMNVLFFSDTC